ncbi:hypothetical protein BJX96DRAFT_175630 [Aspergillus floccosus]
MFVYSHTHGDGKSGLAFHKSLLQGLQTAEPTDDHDTIYRPPLSPFPPPLEDACNLRISWSYLFSSLFGQHLPHRLRRWFTVQAPLPAHAYTGQPITYSPEGLRTGSQILLVPQDLLDSVLSACRAQRGTLTGLLNQLVVRAVSAALPCDALIGQIVIDLRRLVPVYSDNTMGNCVSAAYEVSACAGLETAYGPAFWDAVRSSTARLSEAAGRLEDQPVGLLKYLGRFRPWFLGQVGRRRDASYEISNLGVFDPSLASPAAVVPVPSQDRKDWTVEQVVFSQPANVTAAPLNFQVVTMKDADMVLTLNWQVGVLGGG